MTGIDTLNAFIFTSKPVTTWAHRIYTSVRSTDLSFRTAIIGTWNAIAIAIEIWSIWRAFTLATNTLLAIGARVRIIALYTGIVIGTKLPFITLGNAYLINRMAFVAVFTIGIGIARTYLETDRLTGCTIVFTGIGYPKTALSTVIWNNDIDLTTVVSLTGNTST